jgi:transcriptional regulator with XRE-family HTH domain
LPELLPPELTMTLSPTDHEPGESFRSLLLQLRGRIRLTQRELADRLDVHVHSIQTWESGVSYPSAASLQRLIAVGAQVGAFTHGSELREASTLWAAATRESPRMRTAFDRVWFERVLAGDDVSHEIPREDLSPVRAQAMIHQARRHAWGEAPDIDDFQGRIAERERLSQWLSDERCRIVAILGLGGIGKTLLATRLAHDLASSFDHVYWRSLRDAPTPADWLVGALRLFDPGAAAVPGDESVQLSRLLELLADAVACWSWTILRPSFSKATPSEAIGRGTSATGCCSSPSRRRRTEAVSW